MRLPFTQVDAFADAPFAGNPAAVMPLDAWLDDATLLSFAQENNLSETAFLVPEEGGDADYELRWFTPAAEVALCGHATFASGHVVLGAEPERARVRFRTRRAGLLEVARDGDGYLMALPAWTPTPKPLPEIVATLNLPAVRETLWHESGYALVVVDDPADVVGCAPDLRALAALGPYVIIVAAPGTDTDVISRVFVPAFDIDEDPVTGSAHAVMVPYWAERLGQTEFTAYQASKRGGRLSCRFEGDRVILGGRCVTVIEGTFLLP